MSPPDKRRRSIGKYEGEWRRVRGIAEGLIAGGERELSRVLRRVEAEWREMDAEPAIGTSFGELVSLPRAALVGGRRDLIMSVLLDACTSRTGMVVELGSGSGINLLNLHLWGGPRVPYYALEPTEAGRALAESLARLEPDLDLAALPFDFEDPRFDLPAGSEHVLVFTCHSIEQVTELRRDAITRLFGLGATVTGVHFEPVGWQLREGAEADASRDWALKKHYNRNLMPLLNELADAGEIAIATVVPDIIGDKKRNASALVVWKR